ncbi:outer membrane beta-barrel family protein [uncultured Algibacter sp.]|uniref:outer membrane beta-barrel family protein n=1 Tax=uncultured Algibacter sp. TaxID=298659 RepID=UPI00262F295D|nr:outer membrane beta-barrel family protein [uncultured Algibacter sp.]
MKRLTILTLLLLPTLLISQINIKGKIIDHSQSIAWANVVLTRLNGDIVTGGISDDDGNFNLQTDSGIYNLTISFMGYSNFVKEIKLTENLDLGTIVLKADNTLDEIVITQKKKLIEQKPDRLVFNVENSVTAIGGDALDALSIAPGLSVQNNSISLLGRGESRVMINGRLLQLSAEDLSSYLSAIAASDIKKIEVITSPPAKYEAAGNGGLINIILKKGKLNSWKNSSSIISNINTYNFISLRNSFLYNKNKLSLSLNLNGTKGNSRNTEDFQVFYPSSNWDIDIDSKDGEDNLSAQMLLDYNISKKTTIGIQYLGNSKSPNMIDKSTSRIVNTSNTLDSLLINNGNNQSKVNSHLINLHSNSKLDSLGTNISFDLDYFSYDSDQDRGFITNSFLPSREFQGINAAANTFSNQKIENYSIKTDIEQPLEFVNLSYGIKLSTIKNNSDIRFFNTISGNPVLDTNISNTFKYEENIQAFYINGSKKINEKWDIQLGLRFENTKTKGVSVQLNETNTNSYSKLFPSFYASYNKDENNSFSLSYGKRVERPRFRDLNPFRSVISSNTFSVGNPFLRPSFIDNFDFKYTYKNNFTTNAFLNIRDDGSSIIFTSDVETSTQIATRANFFKQYNFGITQSLLFNKISWLESQNSVTLLGSKTNFTENIGATPQNGFMINANSSNKINLNKTTKLQLDAYYSSPFKTGLFSVGEMHSIDLGISKQFLNKQLQVAVLVKDIFNRSSLNNFESTVNSVKQVYAQNDNNRFIRLSASYSFGNKKVNEKLRNFGNEEEIRRSN